MCFSVFGSKDIFGVRRSLQSRHCLTKGCDLQCVELVNTGVRVVPVSWDYLGAVGEQAFAEPHNAVRCYAYLRVYK